MNGLKVSLAVMDFDFMGGSMGSVVGEKLTRAIRITSYNVCYTKLLRKSGEIEKTSKTKKNLFFKGHGPYIYYAEEVNGQKESMVNVEVVKLSEDMSQIIELITAKNAIV